MKLNTSAGSTFRVHDVESVRTPIETCKTRDNITTILSRVGNSSQSPVLACSGYNSQVIANTPYHSLIGAVHIAFAEHRPLLLSSDVIWITILQGLAQHVRLHCKELQPLLMKHVGRKEIEITLDIEPDSPESDWELVISAFAEALDGENAYSKSLVCDFSTSGLIEKLVSQICVLDVFESFFEYVLYCGCGFPEITLGGEYADWLNLGRKIDGLRPFQIDFWLPHLHEIASQFCRAFLGDVDRSFWQDMYKQTAKYGGDVCNGWIVKLIPYIQNAGTGNWDVINPLLEADSESQNAYRGVSTSELPSGMSVVPFTCIDRTLEPRGMQLIGGLVGIEQDRETFTIQPKIGWAVRKAKLSRWSFLTNSDVQLAAPVSGLVLSELIEELSNSVRWTMNFPGDFFGLYKICDGFSIVNRSGVTWRIRPMAEVAFHYENVKEPASAEPDIRITDGHFLRVCDSSDGRYAVLSSNRQKGGIQLVELRSAEGDCYAVFFGFKDFIAHLVDKVVT